MTNSHYLQTFFKLYPVHSSFTVCYLAHIFKLSIPLSNFVGTTLHIFSGSL